MGVTHGSNSTSGHSFSIVAIAAGFLNRLPLTEAEMASAIRSQSAASMANWKGAKAKAAITAIECKGGNRGHNEGKAAVY